MAPEPSLISPIGYSASSCGYCSPSGERSKEKSSLSYGLWATQMSVEFYEMLMNRGWRRSGSYIYHPDMERTCCPQYTIRLEAGAFRPGKRQRRVQSQFIRYILTGSTDFGILHPSLPKGRPGRGRQNKPFDLLEKLRLAEASQPIASSSSSPSIPSSSSFQTLKPHSFKITLQPSSPPHPSLHPLYVKYQTLIHKDKPPTSLAESFKSFSRFLCSSPLSPTPIAYSHPSLVGLAEGSDARKKKLDELGLPENYGSWHQLYWVDGEVVAFGVLDIVKGGVSSVYFVYDPESGGGELGRMGWGKLSALREIGLVKSMAEAGASEMAHLYLGYYIQSCTKMKYKAEFRPSSLLDPGTNTFHTLAPLIPHLEAHRKGYFSFYNPPALLDTVAELEPASIPVLAPVASATEEGDKSMDWVDEEEETDSKDEEEEEEEEENLKLPTSPPPPSFLDTRIISKNVLAEVPVYLPGRGYMDFASSPHARSKENCTSLKELIAALHGPGPLGGDTKGAGGVLSGEGERQEEVGLILVCF